MKNSELAEGMADAIEKHGWAQGHLGHVGTGFCLLGAGRHVLSLNLSLHLVEQLRSRYIMDSLAFSQVFLTLRPVAPGVAIPYDVEWFNDRFLKNRDEVLAVLDKAAKYWRDKGE